MSKETTSPGPPPEADLAPLREKMRPLVQAAFEEPDRARELGRECASMVVHEIDAELHIWRRVGRFAADPDVPERRRHFDAAVDGVQAGVAEGLRRTRVMPEGVRGRSRPSLAIPRVRQGPVALLAFVAAVLVIAAGAWRIARSHVPVMTDGDVAMRGSPRAPVMTDGDVAHGPRVPVMTDDDVEEIPNARAELQKLEASWKQALAPEVVRFEAPTPVDRIRVASFSEVRRTLQVAKKRVAHDPTHFKVLVEKTAAGIARMQRAWAPLQADGGELVLLPEEQQSVRTYCVFSKLLKSIPATGGEGEVPAAGGTRGAEAGDPDVARDLANFCAGLEPNLEES